MEMTTDREREVRELEAERNRMEVLLQRIRYLEAENEELRAKLDKWDKWALHGGKP